MIALILVMAFVPRSTPATEGSIDPQLASSYFREAAEVCAHDGGKLWGISLCGPILFVAPATRQVVANQADKQAGLTPNGQVFVGDLPTSINVANTALD